MTCVTMVDREVCRDALILPAFVLANFVVEGNTGSELLIVAVDIAEGEHGGSGGTEIMLEEADGLLCGVMPLVTVAV